MAIGNAIGIPFKRGGINWANYLYGQSDLNFGLNQGVEVG